jgi:hypothetical protein
MAEIPYFAAGVPNLISSRRALEIFTALSDVHVDLSELQQQGEAVRRGLLDLMERMRAEAERQGRGDAEDAADEVHGDPDDHEEEESPGSEAPPLDVRSRIERLFDEARIDRSAAFRLKEELDRLGLFEAYEDRFLDLFRRAE